MKYVFSIVIFYVSYFILAKIFNFGETTSVILSLIGTALFYNSKKEIKSVNNNVVVKKESLEKDSDNESVNIFGVKPRSGTEAYRVQQEVEKKKQLIKEKKIDELISELYFDSITYYPSWIKHKDRSYVPVIITSATELNENKYEQYKKVIEITLNERKYKFYFKEKSFFMPDNEFNTHGLLELFNDDKKVFALNLSCKYSEYGSNWTPFDINTFIDGDWVEDFQSLKKQKQKDDKERALKNAEDPEKIDEMKSNFGIE